MSTLSPDVVQHSIIELGRQDPQGFDQQTALDHLIHSFPEHKITVTLLAQTLSQLCQNGRLLAFQAAGSKYRWKLESDDRFDKLRGLSQTDRIVYEVIERSANQGIWIKDLRKRTNMTGNTDLEKSIKTLLTRKLIKSEESIAGKNKKVYMLYELVPAVEVTGGVWYTQKTKDIDTAFVHNMRRAVTVVLHKMGPMSSENLASYLKDRGVAKIKLSSQDIRVLCQTMLYDGVLEYATYHDILDPALKQKYITQYLSPVEHDDEHEDPEPIYALPKVEDIEAIDLTAFASPCTACPLIDSCGSGNVVEPETCQYFQQWIADKQEIEAKEWISSYQTDIIPSQPITNGVAPIVTTTSTTVTLNPTQ